METKTDNNPFVKVIVNGEEVPQDPSREVPDEIVEAVVDMGRISRESEDAQQDSKPEGQ